MLVKLLSVNLSQSVVDLDTLYDGLAMHIGHFKPSIHPRFDKTWVVDVMVNERDLESAHIALFLDWKRSSMRTTSFSYQ